MGLISLVFAWLGMTCCMIKELRETMTFCAITKIEDEIVQREEERRGEEVWEGSLIINGKFFSFISRDDEPLRSPGGVTAEEVYLVWTSDCKDLLPQEMMRRSKQVTPSIDPPHQSFTRREDNHRYLSDGKDRTEKASSISFNVS